MKTNALFYLALSFLIATGCRPQPEAPQQYRDMVNQLHRDMVDKHLTYNLLQLQLQELPAVGETPLRSIDDSGLFLEDLVRTGPLLIFRYSEIHCNSCTDLVIQKMNRWYEAGAIQMAVVASYTEFRHFASFARANRLQMPIFLLDEEEAAGIFDTEIPPYLFVLDQSMTIRYPFVPIKEMADGIDMYLDFVKEKLSGGPMVSSQSQSQSQFQ